MIGDTQRFVWPTAAERVAAIGDLNGVSQAVRVGALVPARVALERQGVEGDLVANSVVINNNNAGSFQLQNNGMLGYILNAPLTAPGLRPMFFLPLICAG